MGLLLSCFSSDTEATFHQSSTRAISHPYPLAPRAHSVHSTRAHSRASTVHGKIPRPRLSTGPQTTTLPNRSGRWTKQSNGVTFVRIDDPPASPPDIVLDPVQDAAERSKTETTNHTELPQISGQHLVAPSYLPALDPISPLSSTLSLIRLRPPNAGANTAHVFSPSPAQLHNLPPIRVQDLPLPGAGMDPGSSPPSTSLTPRSILTPPSYVRTRKTQTTGTIRSNSSLLT